MVDKLFKLLLLISPIAFTSGIALDRFEIVFFHFGVIGLFMASLLDTPKRKSIPVAKEIVLFLALCFFNIAIHSFQFYSIGLFLNIFLFCLALNIVYQHMKEPKEYYKYIIIAAFINIVAYLGQRFYFNFLPFAPTVKVIGVIEWGGIFGTAPNMANYLAIITPIIFSTFWFAIPVMAVLLNQLLPAVVLAGMVVWKVRKSKIRDILYVIVGVLSIGFIIFYHKHILESIDLRLFRVYKPVIAEVFKTPFVGHGLGTCYIQFGTVVFNSFLPFIYDVGMLGLVLLGYIAYKIKGYLTLGIGTLSILTLILVSMLDSPIEDIRLWFTIIFIIASFFYPKEETQC
jgi:hypothetical protein